MKITRKFTVRNAEPDLNLSMTPYFSGYSSDVDITVRLYGSEAIETPNGHVHKSYSGKMEMSVVEAFQLIKELHGAILHGYQMRKEKP